MMRHIRLEGREYILLGAQVEKDTGEHSLLDNLGVGDRHQFPVDQGAEDSLLVDSDNWSWGPGVVGGHRGHSLLEDESQEEVGEESWRQDKRSRAGVADSRGSCLSISGAVR